MNLSQKFLQKLDESTETKLSSPKVEKLSIVDQPANQEEFLFAKNTDMNKELEKALNDAVSSIREVNKHLEGEPSSGDDLLGELEGELNDLFSKLDEDEGDSGDSKSTLMEKWDEEQAISLLKNWKDLEGSPSDLIDEVITKLSGEEQEDTEKDSDDSGPSLSNLQDRVEKLEERVEEHEEGMEKMDQQFAEFLSQLTGEDVEKQSRMGEWIMDNLGENEDVTDLATAVDLSESSVNDIIEGEVIPTGETVDRIAGYFGVDRQELVDLLPEGQPSDGGQSGQQNQQGDQGMQSDSAA